MAAETVDQPRLLIVDDAPQNLRLLNGILRGNYRISVAVSGLEALELAAARPPDLILLDVSMPGMDGFEVCRRLKAAPATQEIPVIFVTGLTEEEGRSRGIEAGGADFIVKPIDPVTLQAKITACLGYSLTERGNGG
ncbi:response regulator [Desulfuromonas acetexigens]|uniref:Response regulator n=1 Tax=Trichloromonas acetexigens TaxID=38815 RepID=A0A550JL82_9BACT|nr:response regulator [Desulfuromonas acetexigens]TRO83969.1 response regulator [Desulfuromonas acetexigens]